MFSASLHILGEIGDSCSAPGAMKLYQRLAAAAVSLLSGKRRAYAADGTNAAGQRVSSPLKHNRPRVIIPTHNVA